MGASQFYSECPPNTTMRPRRGGGGGASLGPRGRGLSEAPGGLQLSSAGTGRYTCSYSLRELALT